MNDPLLFMLNVAEGPIFRFSFALLVLGVLRWLVIAVADTWAAYLVNPDASTFRRKLGMRIAWQFFPYAVLRQAGLGGRGREGLYQAVLGVLSLLFRVTAIAVPAFMVAHVYLWKRGLGLTWPSLPAQIADVLSVMVIVLGGVLFLGRLYSPTLRRIEPGWAFLKPLILIIPFATGMLAMHPAYCWVDYHVVRLLHVLSAALVFVMIPFARMLSCVHPRLIDVVPEAAWGTEEGDAIPPETRPAVSSS